MSVNAISMAMSAASYIKSSGSNLPDWLLEKLTDLGIDSSSVSSVSEANSLISKAEETGETEQTDENGQGEGSSDLMDRATRLAEKLGIEVKDSDTIDDVLEEIQEVIDELMDVAVKNNDESLYNTLQDYQMELDILVTENNGGGIANSVVFDFMELLAEQNKYALGLENNK